MKRTNNISESGFTLIEILLVLLILAMILIAAPATFRSGTQVWEKGDRHAEVLQNALIGMEEMTRDLRQASRVTDVSAPDASNGYIEFEYRDDTDGDGDVDYEDGHKYQLYQQAASSGSSD